MFSACHSPRRHKRKGNWSPVGQLSIPTEPPDARSRPGTSAPLQRPRRMFRSTWYAGAHGLRACQGSLSLRVPCGPKLLAAQAPTQIRRPEARPGGRTQLLPSCGWDLLAIAQNQFLRCGYALEGFRGESWAWQAAVDFLNPLARVWSWLPILPLRKSGQGRTNKGFVSLVLTDRIADLCEPRATSQGKLMKSALFCYVLPSSCFEKPDVTKVAAMKASLIGCFYRNRTLLRWQRWMFA